jgi:dTDP-glucose 4,6-dehydratase
MIINLDKLDYCSSLKNLTEIERYPNYQFIKGDITSPDLVKYIISKENVDVIMHFAAQSHVDNSFGNSFDFTVSNVLGTHVLLEGAKEFKDQIKLFMHVSTDEVYGDGISGVASLESTVLEPTNPYAASKAGAEYLVKAYHRSFKVPIIITRSNNVYGPHQYPEKIIPKFISQLSRGQPVTLHGNGLNTRNYLYVTDVANAFDLIFHKGEVAEVYNIGGSNEISNIDVARTLMRLLGLVDDTDPIQLHSKNDGRPSRPEESTPTTPVKRHSATAALYSSFIPAPGSETYVTLSDPDAAADLAPEEEALVLWVPDRPFNDLRYSLDSKKVRALGWKERTSWEDGLKQTVEWYKHNLGNWRPEDLLAALAPHPRRGTTKDV